MSGLEPLGIPGGDHLREALTNCSDPLAAIEEFQQENGVLLPSLKPALPFLDLHGVKRCEFHQSVLEEVREKLIQKINEVVNGDDKERFQKIETMLEKSFCVIRVASLRPVIMNMLKTLPKIKDVYLKEILDDKELYKEAATEVKRQIWEENQALFGDEVSPLLSQYIREKENTLFSHENSLSTFFLMSPKARRQGEVVQKLTHMVGKSVRLYDMVLQFLRTLFLRTRNMHYCTLRAELLMSLHDQEVNDICAVDPCHKFTWCVDACIREKFVDSKRARELQGFLDGIKRGQEFVLGDLSMILCDPYALNTVALSIMKALQQCINNDVLPRESTDIILLLRMLGLGLGAWDMIDSQVFKEPKLEPVLITKFLPTLAGTVVDDQIRPVVARLSDEAQPVQRPPSQLFLIFIKESEVAAMMALYYTLQVCKNRDKVAICQMLPCLTICQSERHFDDTFLHSLVSYLISMAEEFTNDDFHEVVFNQFFKSGMSKHNVLRHMLRLVYYVHPRIPQEKLTVLMEALKPNQGHSDIINTTYNALVDKIESYQPSPTAQAERLDSPLMSVPAPTPAMM
ncbi:negative elongation factor B-like [Ruditapes philippinarum]|uniref:negative elongation factor B-like n=1 Tax=Ruditapes philippinarum TaxID=129788 RepID=UPI00295AFC20|nr:negative elongation factor B-like [Ruditapes philippinarum]